MFYDHNQVEDLLNCVNCGERYDTPLLLPCWKTICSQCVSNLTQIDSDGVEKLTCPFCCDTVHEIPDNGYAVNEALNSLLKLKPVDVHRAELFKIIGDLLKKIQYNINDLDNMEQSIKYNLYDYFELIKNEIQSSAQTLIDQAIKYRDTLLNQIDYLKEQSTSYFNELFSQQGPLSDLRKKCNQKKHEWQSSIEKCSSSTNADENKINAIIREADKLNLKLNETRLFIQNSINSRKLVFNQAEPTYMDSKTSIIGQLDFQDQVDLVDHKLKVKLMNEFVKCRRLELSSMAGFNLSRLVPFICDRLVLVTKTGYDDFSDNVLTMLDLNGKQMAKNTENNQSRINALGSYSNYVLLALTDQKSGRELIKIYNASLQLITSIVTEFKCEQFFFNDSYLYTKLESNYPYCYKFDYDLLRHPLFESFTAQTELFVSFVVDKLIHISSNTNRIYFNDKCFSRLKIFSEMTGQLIGSIRVDSLRECSIRIDSSLVNSDQFLCLNKEQRVLRVYDASDGSLLSENFLCKSIRNISNFYLTKDGNYVFEDTLNDCVYFY